jgi:hypothetical protein
VARFVPPTFDACGERNFDTHFALLVGGVGTVFELLTLWFESLQLEKEKAKNAARAKLRLLRIMIPLHFRVE